MTLDFQRLGIADVDFWGGGPFPSEGEWRLRLAEARHEGLLLDAPEQVDPASRSTLPLVVGWGASFARAAQTPFDSHAVVTAVDLRRNRLRVARAVDLDRTIPFQPDPNAVIPSGHLAGFHEVEGRDRLQLPWESGTWLLRAILRDTVSNPRPVTLLGEDPSDPVPSSAIDPPEGDPVPSYRGDGPAFPVDEGIQLEVPRVTPLAEHARVVLRGAFRLPALEHERVEAWDGDAPAPQAVITVNVYLTLSDQPLLSVRRLQVPCYQPADEAGLYAGRFAVDVLPWLERRSVTAFAYAFSGTQLAGPIPAALVAQDDLPEGSG